MSSYAGKPSQLHGFSAIDFPDCSRVYAVGSLDAPRDLDAKLNDLENEADLDDEETAHAMKKYQLKKS